MEITNQNVMTTDYAQTERKKSLRCHQASSFLLYSQVMSKKKIEAMKVRQTAYLLLHAILKTTEIIKRNGVRAGVSSALRSVSNV